ncbi:MAG: galactokinase [Firmicutes bacterium]|nr:galactokinase [Bacillota bacterium]
MPSADRLKATLIRDVAGERFRALVDTFVGAYGDGDLQLFSAPGRAEIGGNHTDHQHGRVLAASVNLDIACVARRSEEPRIRIASPGFPEVDITLDTLEPVPAEAGDSAALARGMAAGFVARGLPVAGFDAVTVSNVFPGSGLSSSAALETLIGVILRKFGGGAISAEDIAILAQRAENRFFGKPCGLMDQMACAVGGLIAIDFKDPAAPVVERVAFDFAASGHALCVTGPIGSHADLTPAYAAIPREMRQVAEAFGKNFLREVSPEEFYAALPSLYGKLPDRALLRAMHFFAEDARVPEEVQALRFGDFAAFLRLVNESGRSSFQYLQNVYYGDEMGLCIALFESERVLNGAGAIRIQGGGFAGTIQAFVPLPLVPDYAGAMDRIFGAGACHALTIRPVGAAAIEVDP